MNYDLGAFTGHWPFHRIRGEGPAEQLDLRRRRGIGGGLVSSLDAVFYQDPWEADGPLTRALVSEKNWSVALSVNPMLPHAALELTRAAGSAGAVRLYPGVHGYEPDDEESVRLCRLAGALGLPVIITARLEDARLEYLLRQRPVEINRAVGLAERCGGTRFLLSNFYLSELNAVDGPPDNVWADTAGLCHGLFPFEELKFPLKRMVFGSCAPLQCLDSGLWNVPEPLRELILSENPEAFLKGEG